MPAIDKNRKVANNAEATEVLQEAMKKLQAMDEYIEQVASKPTQMALVLRVGVEEGHRFADVAMGGIMRLPLAFEFEVKAGDDVLVVPGRGIISVVTSRKLWAGPIVSVTSIVERQTVEVDVDGTPQVVSLVPDLYDKVKVGTRLMLDVGEQIALRKLPDPPAPVADVKVERIAWGDVAGQEQAKQAIERAVIWPKKHGALLSAYGQRPSAGILFYGPPGCGKTLLAKATATELAKGVSGNAPGFFSVRGPELMNKYVGETERMIRALFAAARDHEAKTGARGVVFVDEADSALGHRGRSLANDISVPAFLVEMDGIESRYKPLVMLATNRLADLDEAIVREGRVDTRIEVQRPDTDGVSKLFALYLKARPVKDSMNALIEHSTEYIEATPLWQFRSGALVASLVDRMTSHAMERDIRKRTSVPSGITLDDSTTAITLAAMQRNITMS